MMYPDSKGPILDKKNLLHLQTIKHKQIVGTIFSGK